MPRLTRGQASPSGLRRVALAILSWSFRCLLHRLLGAALQRDAGRAAGNVGRIRPPAQKLLAVKFQVLPRTHARAAELRIGALFIEPVLLHQQDDRADDRAATAATTFEILNAGIHVTAQQELVDAHEQRRVDGAAMDRLTQEGSRAEIDQRLEAARRLDADQADHRHRRQARGRIDLDRNRALEIAVDEQDVALGLQAADDDLRAAADDVGIFSCHTELGEGGLERAFPSAASDDDKGAAALEILQQSTSHVCTTLSTGERIALAKRGDDWTR